MEIYHIENNDLFESKPDTLQRSVKWFNKRLGRFTGSKMKDLMGCTQFSKSFQWGMAEKIMDFSETAKKYIYTKAMERKTQKVLERSIGKNGDYGEKAEKQIIDLLESKYPDSVIEETGFIEFIKDVAGSSPDGKFNDIGLEIKAAMSWDGVFLRMETPFDSKHIDFWQIQSEMLSLQVNELMYVVAEPATDVFEPVIDGIQEKIVYGSPIHQDSIIKRCMIANDAIDLFLKGENFHKAIDYACENFKFN